MEINIEYIANLARLDNPSTTEEANKLRKDMTEIIGMVDKMSEVDTTGVEPTNHAAPMQNVFRKDELKPSFARDEMLANAPESVAGCYSVPSAVEDA
ncbi:MAG: Asp-tRNA(Asn)/Glu-tRNA(Gln) amidotransferase subunit GatC [Clostridiales bacterium]|nr:Asp-tRNA(Asn)/Glu-tRNA(Gln) amidotransferase subunit GatC [Clostridiales bacterium]